MRNTSVNQMATLEHHRDEMIRLAEFLRQNPESLRLDADEIAARSQTSAQVVRDALARSEAQSRSERPVVQRKLPKFRVSKLLDGLFAFPLAFVAVTFVIAVLVATVLPDAPAVQKQGQAVAVAINDVIEISTFAAVFLLHFLCFAWRGLSRHALYSSVFIGVVGGGLAFFAANRSQAMRVEPALPLYMTAAVVMGAVLYAVVGVGAASLGAYARFRREERNLRHRTRQQLLQRLFEIEEAMKAPAQAPEVRRFAWPWLQQVRKRLFVYAALCGFCLSIFSASMTLAFPGPTGEAMRKVSAAERMPDRLEGSKVRTEALKGVSPGFFISQFIFASLSVLVQLGLAYLAGRPVRAILVSLTCGFSASVGAMLPIGTMGYDWFAAQWESSLISGTIMAVLVGLFAGVGATVEERALQTRRRLANDPAVLLAEFVDIHRSLNSGGQSKSVLVVDAAKSSVMKSSADPLVAEWSFRAYQQFIADIVRECGGNIHSTAGDGAMAAFDRPEDAFRAARTLQTRISDFNAYVNRLKDPFRIRIGIHCGEVSGDLDEVEFTAVLDIAAHVEAASQVGGIAVTAPVAEALQNHRFAAIQNTVDGFQVFLAMNPTLDPEAGLEDA